MVNIEELVKMSREMSRRQACARIEYMLHCYKPLFLSLCSQSRYSLIKEESMSICACKCSELIESGVDIGNVKFPGYLKQCLIHELNNAVRKAERNRRRETTDLEGIRTLPQLIVDGEDKLLDRLVLEEAWQKLPLPQRHLLKLYFGQELTQKEIATILCIKQGTVAKELAKALSRLRELCR